MMSDKIPQHQWTHDGNRVLLIKCLDKDGKSHGGFQYPQSGPVQPLCCSMKPDCESGGLFGWAWGINLGGGKNPDYREVWAVLSAPPEQVVLIGDKCKVAANTPAEVDCIVEYYGDALGAMIRTLAGRVAWIEHNSSGSASATGESGSASATGASGSASATGWSGSASATGARGSASATGASGSASATGERDVAVISGEYGTIEVGPDSLGAVTANRWFWRVHTGSVIAAKWKTENGHQHVMLVADDMGLQEGSLVEIIDGKIVNGK